MLSGSLEAIREEGFGDRASLELLMRSCCASLWCYRSISDLCETCCHCLELIALSIMRDCCLLVEMREGDGNNVNASKRTEFNGFLYILLPVYASTYYRREARATRPIMNTVD